MATILILIAVVSVETVFLAIFIKKKMNRHNADIKDIQEDIEELGEGVDEVSEAVQNLEEKLEDISEVLQKQEFEELRNLVQQISDNLGALKNDVKK